MGQLNTKSKTVVEKHDNNCDYGDASDYCYARDNNSMYQPSDYNTMEEEEEEEAITRSKV